MGKNETVTIIQAGQTFLNDNKMGTFDENVKFTNVQYKTGVIEMKNPAADFPCSMRHVWATLFLPKSSKAKPEQTPKKSRSTTSRAEPLSRLLECEQLPREYKDSLEAQALYTIRWNFSRMSAKLFHACVNGSPMQTVFKMKHL
ncbi:MAG: hypothetical protein Pg6C_11630 [Treponemataceae bacterium]|nr:MAG: hypothetical protein Pg6C_11630 [Treponemataceae bacterium]